VSGRYTGEISQFKVAGAIAYNESTDETGPGRLTNTALSAQAFQAGGYLQHIPTGLFVYGAYSKEFIDSLSIPDPDGAGALVGGNASTKPEGDQWYIKAGVRQHWNPLGHTVLFGEYGENSDRLSALAFQNGVLSSELTQYGVGVVQEIDNAAMSVWLSWRHYEADLTLAPVNNLGLNASGIDDLDIVKAGALINF
jgi:hypothetical protein